MSLSSNQSKRHLSLMAEANADKKLAVNFGPNEHELMFCISHIEKEGKEIISCCR